MSTMVKRIVGYHLVPVLTAWSLVLSHLEVMEVQAFQVPPAARTMNLFSTSTCSNNIRLRLFASVEKDQQEEEGTSLSEMDARVLQSMLQDSGKLDLETEESLKKLLERGVVSKDVPKAPKRKQNDSEFSSQVLQTLGDTQLWQSVSRKAGDWFESAKLYVANRVERDAMTLAALGLFAWERAIRDVGRALPAAGNATRGRQDTPPNQPFLLSSKSSFVTPMDELKSVGTAVAEILRTGGTTTATASTTIRTAATSRQDKRNFQRSYDMAQKRASQNKNPVKVTQQAASSVVDTAWQLKRELQVEDNKPGYKTKQVQTALEAAKDSTKQLLQGARDTWRLERAKRKQQQVLPSTSSTTTAAEGFMDAQTEAFAESHPETKGPPMEQPQTQHYQQQQDIDDPEYAQRLEEAQKRAEWQQAEWQEQQRLRRLELAQQQREQQQEQLQLLMETEQELQTECFRLKEQLQYCIVNPEQTWLRPDIIDGIQNFDQVLIKQVVSELIATRNSLKEVIKQQGLIDDNNGEANDQQMAFTEETVMVATQRVPVMLEELVTVRNMVEELQDHASRAVSWEASQALKEFVLEAPRKDHASSIQDDNLIPFMLRLDDIQRTFESLDWSIGEEVELEEEEDGWMQEEYSNINVEDWYQEEGEQAQQPAATFFAEAEAISIDDYGYNMNEFQDHDVEDVSSSETYSSSYDGSSTAIDPEVVEVIPEAFVYAVATAPFVPGEDSTSPSASSNAQAEVASSVVELVTDDDFEAAVGETKRTVAVNYDEDDETAVASKEKNEDNVIFNLFLRALDIIFFLLEKTFTVAIPTLLSSGSVAKERLDEVARGGLGSEGWERIGNAKTGAKRY